MLVFLVRVVTYMKLFNGIDFYDDGIIYIGTKRVSAK